MALAFSLVLKLTTVLTVLISKNLVIGQPGIASCQNYFNRADGTLARRVPTRLDPIDLYKYRTVRYNDGRRVVNVNIPTAVHARLRRQVPPCPRRNFPRGGWVDRQMNAMGKWIDDEKGHLIASQLCGPIEPYNLAPQQPSLNRNRFWRQGWINMENDAVRYLANPGWQVDMTVVPNYGGLTRPRSFMVCMVALDQRGNQVGYRRQEFINGL